ncbi:MAG: DUF3105 domain-containing protein, partial [Ornithinibacter sp.]
MAKKTERDNRRAIAEQMRKEQARKERRRSVLILGGSVVVVLGLLAAAVIPYVKNVREERKAAGTPLADFGVSASAAKCSPVTKKKATGNNNHLDVNQKIPYPDAPPASGPHWGNFLQGSELRPFYTTSDRPPVERLVHSLEHGHTILWYDDTVTQGSKSYQDLKTIADKLGTDAYFMVAPWTASDGAQFPSGKHLALTHWTGPRNQEGVTQYCAAASGSAVESFTKDYPASNAP